MEYIQMYQVLNISDERAKEIEKHVMAALKEAKRMDEGTQKLAQRYDAESMLVGMLLDRILMDIAMQRQRSTINTSKHPERN